MRKIILAFAILTLALPSNAYSESLMCAVAPSTAGSAVGNFLSNITGTNFLMTKVAEVAVQNSLKKELASKFNVQIKSFGGLSFIDGKFKSIEVKSKKIASDDINATDFNAKSICDYNQIKLVNNEVYFLENFLMDFNAKITDADLKRTILSPTYLNLIKKVDFNAGPITLFKLHNPTIEIKNNRIYMTIQTDTAGLLRAKTQTFKMDTALTVEDEKIVFSDINFNGNRNINLNSVLPLINRLNPFAVKTKINSHDYATIKIKNVKIQDNTIVSSGLVVIPKSNYVPN